MKKLKKTNQKIMIDKNFIRKNLLRIFIMLFVVNLQAQLIVDDFSTGNFAKMIFNSGTSAQFFQTGTSIVGNIRRIHVAVTQNTFNHSIQVTNKSGVLAISAGYDTRGTVYVGYGHNNSGLAPMNLNLSKYKSLKIEFAAKSTINGMNVTLFTGTSHAFNGSHVQAREDKFIFEIPLSQIKKIGEKYTLSDIDYIRFQFDSRSKTGCAMAIDKIWFE